MQSGGRRLVGCLALPSSQLPSLLHRLPTAGVLQSVAASTDAAIDVRGGQLLNKRTHSAAAAQPWPEEAQQQFDGDSSPAPAGQSVA